jgi:Saxitoxin biosynthesis operon protein SxtJ
MASGNFHEDLGRHGDEPRASERNLGITFAVVLALIGALKLYRVGEAGLYWLAAAALFLVCALFWTAPLRPLNLVWHRLGLLLFAVVSPIVMGVVFFTTVAPIGLLMRLVGKDPLRLKFDRAARSYWIERHPPGPAGPQMKNQF